MNGARLLTGSSSRISGRASGFAYDPSGRRQDRGSRRIRHLLRSAGHQYRDGPGRQPAIFRGGEQHLEHQLVQPVRRASRGRVGQSTPSIRTSATAWSLSYNFNVQHEAAGIVFQAAYVGSEGRHLRIIGGWNQGINGVRPISGFSSITHAAVRFEFELQRPLAERQPAAHPQPDLQHVLCLLEIDRQRLRTAQFESAGAGFPQPSRRYALLSDFDARNRFVLSAVYLLPVQGTGAFRSRLAAGVERFADRQLPVGESVQPDHSSDGYAREPGGIQPAVPGAGRPVCNPAESLTRIQWINRQRSVQSGHRVRRRRLSSVPHRSRICGCRPRRSPRTRRSRSSAPVAVPERGVQPLQPSELRAAAEIITWRCRDLRVRLRHDEDDPGGPGELCARSSLR